MGSPITWRVSGTMRKKIEAYICIYIYRFSYVYIYVFVQGQWGFVSRLILGITSVVVSIVGALFLVAKSQDPPRTYIEL